MWDSRWSQQQTRSPGPEEVWLSVAPLVVGCPLPVFITLWTTLPCWSWMSVLVNNSLTTSSWTDGALWDVQTSWESTLTRRKEPEEMAHSSVSSAPLLATSLDTKNVKSCAHAMFMYPMYLLRYKTFGLEFEREKKFHPAHHKFVGTVSQTWWVL